MTFIHTINNAIEPLRRLSDTLAVPLYDLFLRVYVAHIFLKSGWLRFSDVLNGSWDTQLYLFEYEHPVPFLSPSIAAPITTGAELVLPVLLILGLFGRFAAAGLLVMILLIELTYTSSLHHLLWGVMLASTFLRGPGILSADYWFVKQLKKQA